MRNDFQTNYLMHYGIPGQKWGVRNYQNPDGSLTAAGRERYGVGPGRETGDISSAKGIQRRLNDLDKAKARNIKTITKNLKKASRKSSISNDNKYSKKVLEAQKNIDKGEKEIESLLNKAGEMDYDVSAKSTRRLVSSGAEIIGGTVLKSALASGMLLPFGHVAVVPHVQTVKGTKYKVDDTAAKAAGDNKVKETASKAHTWIGDADETFSFLAKNSYDNITDYGNRVGDVKNAKKYDKTEMKEVFRDAFGGDNAAQRKALKMLYAAEVSRYMDEESSDPGSSQVFRNAKADNTGNRLSDLLVGDSWGSDSANEWKSYMEDNIGQKIKALSSQEKADALKETGLYYTEEDLENIRKHG